MFGLTQLSEDTISRITCDWVSAPAAGRQSTVYIELTKNLVLRKLQFAKQE